MAIVTTPNATQIAEIRSHIGMQFNAGDISPELIRSDSYFGGAYDFVFESVVKGLKTRPADATALSALFNESVRSTQEGQFNRAVIYRCAGLLVGPAEYVTGEGAGGVSQSYLREQKADRQTYLFGLADDEIRRLREALPNDLFTSVPLRADLLSGATFFASTGSVDVGAVGAQAPPPSGNPSLPSGGSPGQILVRTTDGYEWQTPFSLPSNVAAGQLLRRNSDNTAFEWFNPLVVPSGGTTGQLLRKTDSGYEWATVSGQFNPSNTGETGNFLAKTATGYQWIAAPSGAFAPANTGTAGQHLVKTSGGYTWQNAPTSFGPSNTGSTDQILTKTATGYQWSDAPSGLPSGGSTGQYLQKTSTGYTWASIPVYTSFSPANTGTTGQVLKKTSSGYQWENESGGSGNFSPANTGSTGQYLAKTATGYQWQSIPTYTSFAPSNTGTTNQVLTKTSSGYQWSDASGGGFGPSNTGATGQYLQKTSGGYQWSGVIEFEPANAGTKGQVLTKTSTDGWQQKSAFALTGNNTAIAFDGTHFYVGEYSGDIRCYTPAGVEVTGRKIARATLSALNSGFDNNGMAFLTPTELLIVDQDGGNLYGLSRSGDTWTRNTANEIDLGDITGNPIGRYQAGGVATDGTTIWVAHLSKDQVFAWEKSGGSWGRASGKDMSQAMLHSAYSSITPSSMTHDGTGLLVGDAQSKKLWGFKFENSAWARDSNRDLDPPVSAISAVWSQGNDIAIISGTSLIQGIRSGYDWQSPTIPTYAGPYTLTSPLSWSNRTDISTHEYESTDIITATFLFRQGGRSRCVSWTERVDLLINCAVNSPVDGQNFYVTLDYNTTTKRLQYASAGTYQSGEFVKVSIIKLT